jgi:hypothetical protein
MKIKNGLLGVLMIAAFAAAIAAQDGPSGTAQGFSAPGISRPQTPANENLTPEEFRRKFNIPAPGSELSVAKSAPSQVSGGSAGGPDEPQLFPAVEKLTPAEFRRKFNIPDPGSDGSGLKSAPAQVSGGFSGGVGEYQLFPSVDGLTPREFRRRYNIPEPAVLTTAHTERMSFANCVPSGTAQLPQPPNVCQGSFQSQPIGYKGAYLVQCGGQPPNSPCTVTLGLKDDNLSTGLNDFTTTQQFSISCGQSLNRTIIYGSIPGTGTHRITAWIVDDVTGTQISLTSCTYTVQ